eukprot:scaffold10546_cov59-Phaeocystis_antarctica.AAC.3
MTANGGSAKQPRLHQQPSRSWASSSSGVLSFLSFAATAGKTTGGSAETGCLWLHTDLNGITWLCAGRQRAKHRSVRCVGLKLAALGDVGWDRHREHCTLSTQVARGLRGHRGLHLHGLHRSGHRDRRAAVVAEVAGAVELGAAVGTERH